MQEKDGWKRVRATVPDSRIIIRAARKARKARKYHKHHKIYVRGAHYEYLFEKVAGVRSIIYRRRLKYYERYFFLKHLYRIYINLKYAIKGLTNGSKLLLTFLGSTEK